MLQRFKANYRSLLGVDISPTSVKILEISLYHNRFCIEGYGYKRLPSNTLEQNREKIRSCIKKLLAKINSSAKFAAVAVPDSTVISKTIQLVDSLNEREMEELILLEAGKYLAYPSDKISIDFAIIGPSKTSLGMLDVQLLASREDNVSRRVDLLRDAGLEVKLVDIESYVLASVIEQLFPKNSHSKLIALIIISYESIKIFVYENGKSIYTQEEAFDTSQLQAIEQAAQLENKPTDYNIVILDSFIDSALKQIKRSLHYFFSTCHFDFLEQIFLAGEISVLTELVQKVQAETGSPTSVADPFKSLSFSNNINLAEFRKQAPRFLIALGLALRQVHDN
ncbi:MAG: type IV pilus assembly protein PilM [Tatlockia sp.]|nr:type IV pilus assembly protein PilM [Tatlockia sp.]